MNKERYGGLSRDHRKIIDDLSGLTLSLKGAEAFDGAGPALGEDDAVLAQDGRS